MASRAASKDIRYVVATRLQGWYGASRAAFSAWAGIVSLVKTLTYTHTHTHNAELVYTYIVLESC